MCDDAQRIDQALAGRPEAFGELVLKYQDRLFQSMFHMVGHAEDAADIVQEAFVQAFLKLESFGRRSAFYTWLYRIAFNAAVARHRRRRATVSIDCIKEKSRMELSDEQNDPREALERKDRCRRVREAISRLSEEHRAVVILREIEGCDYETIAEMLDWPVGTVRSRLHRARLQLRESLRTLTTSDR